MKRTLLFIIICEFCFSSIMSQSLQVLDGTTPVTNGSIYYVWGDSLTGTKMSLKLNLKNISSSTVGVRSKKIETSLISGTSSNMCFAGQCYLSTVFTSLQAATIASNEVDTSFIGEYSPKGHLGESIVTFVFFNTSDTNDSAWVEVRFNATPAGISESTVSNTEISNPYPNPAVDNTTFNYSFAQNTTTAKFVLCDLLGSKVIETEINDLNGVLNVNTSNLNGGIYFYSFYADNKMVLTRKLIVKR